MLPKHVAIIMDGNGRWANSRGLPRTAGHREGAEAVRRTVRHARRLGIECLTLYAFSSRNWGRPAPEVHDLMALLAKFLVDELLEMKDNGIALAAIGDLEALPVPIQHSLEAARQATAEGRMRLVLALSYDGRRDLARAANRLIERSRREDLGPVGEAEFARELSTYGLPDVDLLIRTSGEQRLSGFLPFEATYAELYFTEQHWPDFGEADLDAALAEFASRQRRFGLTGDQVPARP